MSEHITAAAFIIGGTLAVSMPPPARHHHLMRLLEKEGFVKRVNSDMQGFITSTGRFVDRFEAMTIAREAGQLIVRKSGRLGGEISTMSELYSEDVW